LYFTSLAQSGVLDARQTKYLLHCAHNNPGERMPSTSDPYNALAQCLDKGTKLGSVDCTAITVSRQRPDETSVLKLQAYVGGCDSSALCSLLKAHELGHITKEYLMSELSKIDISKTKCSQSMIERIKQLIEQISPVGTII
jgi:hypothetical protein